VLQVEIQKGNPQIGFVKLDLKERTGKFAQGNAVKSGVGIQTLKLQSGRILIGNETS
jgi:hypothetical protein